MNVDADGIVQLLIGTALIALVTDHFRLRAEVNSFRLHVAEYYLKREGLQEVKDEVKEIRNVVFGIAGKLGVSVIKTGE